MNSTVITYYTEIPEFKCSHNNKELLELWKKNWKSKGWDTVVLTDEDAKSHKDMQTIDLHNNDSLLVRGSRLDAKYLWNCYLRWFAYANYVQENGAILWSDFDVMNCNLKPEQLESKKVLPDTAFDGSLCSGILSSNGSKLLTKGITSLYNEDEETISKITVFLSSKTDKDVNDMILLHALNIFKIHFICTGLRMKGISQERAPFEINGEYKLERFPLIHFHHGLLGNPDYLNFPEITSRKRTDVIKHFFEHKLNAAIF